MTGSLPDPGRPSAAERLVPTTIAAFAYLAMPLLLGSGLRPVTHFQQLADAFLHGRLTIRILPAEAARPHVVDELIPAEQPNRYYCAYPPLPAFVLMPVVAIAGPAASVATACQVISILNVWLFAACLWRLPHRLEQPDSSPATRTTMTLFFALGTVCWHNAEMGGDWHLAHAVALTAMLLALREFLDRGRLTLIGGFVALAVLARPPAALTAVFFVLPAIRQRRVPDIVRFAAFPAFAALLLASYNHARFGSPTDLGYDRMILNGVGRQLMEQFGQFHPHFVLRNAFWFFLAPPWATPAGRFPYLGFDPRGLSLFAASPALLYAVVALWRRSREPLVRDSLLGTIACLIPLLLYFNTGFAQFGHRFSLDYLTLLMVLVVAGVGPRPTKLAYTAIAASILIQATGVLLDPITILPERLAPGP